MQTRKPPAAARRAVAAPMPRPPPVTTMTLSTLAAPQEQLVEVGERQLVPGRAAMVAAARALRLFHLAQQRVHLGHRQHAVGAYRGMAGHGGEQLVLAGGQHLARAVIADVLEEVAR